MYQYHWGIYIIFTGWTLEILFCHRALIRRWFWCCEAQSESKIKQSSFAHNGLVQGIGARLVVD